jgi:hypothetical protein
MPIRLRTLASSALVAFALGGLTPAPASAQIQPILPLTVPPFYRAVGSWFGRAIPFNTVCTHAEDPTCPVPNEIIMV